MKDEDLLSKKDLLGLTGISYGQLYRWKRQNLIPESWFIKQSSYTGQETFFPREKILLRVKTILELKDKYSLEELAELISPESRTKLLGTAELLRLSRLAPRVVTEFESLFAKSQFVFREVIFMDVLSKLELEYSCTQEELTDYVRSIKQWLLDIKNTLYRFILCQREGQRFSLLLQQDVPLFLDHKTQEIMVLDLDELAKDLNLELNKVLGEG